MSVRGVWRAVPALVVLVAATYMQDMLRLVPFYRGLYRQYPFFVPESLKNLAQAGLCMAAICLTHGIGFRAALDELRLLRSIPRALAFGVLATLPLVCGLAATRSVGRIQLANLLYLAVWSPFVEELVARGFAISQLHRRSEWPLWAAIATTATLSGLAHVEKGASPLDVLGLFLLTGAGAVAFSWIYVRWDSLWAPFSLHLFMNLWWEVFSVAGTALGGWFPFALQTACIASAILLTVWLTQPRPRG